MVKHLREKLKSHRESQKGTRADAIIQIHPPNHQPTTTITFQTNCIVSMSQNFDCYDTPICKDTPVCQDTTIFKTLQSVKTLHSVKILQTDKKLQSVKTL